MTRAAPSSIDDSETEYRAIEAALLETARGRWFLAEHGRRARRLDSALLEDAIARLQTSLREPPALLGQLQAEIESLKAYLDHTRGALLARTSGSAEAPGASAQHSILKAAEDIHDVAWALQANPFDPAGCELIARNAGKLYALSQAQAVESQRALDMAAALDEAVAKLNAMLETVAQEMRVDTAAATGAMSVAATD